MPNHVPLDDVKRGHQTRNRNAALREKLMDMEPMRRADVIWHSPQKGRKRLMTVLLPKCTETCAIYLSAESFFDIPSEIEGTFTRLGKEVFVHQDDREQGSIVAERQAMLQKVREIMKGEWHGVRFRDHQNTGA